VLLFRDLDLELRQAGQSLDAVTGDLLEDRVGLKRLGELVTASLQAPSRVLAPVLRAAGADRDKRQETDADDAAAGETSDPDED
jgi:hypothetical protein